MGEPLLVVGKERFAGIDIRVRVSGGGRIAQIYAIRQAVARAIVAYYQKYVDEQSLSRIPEERNPKSSVDPVPVPDTRNRTVKSDEKYICELTKKKKKKKKYSALIPLVKKKKKS